VPVIGAVALAPVLDDSLAALVPHKDPADSRFVTLQPPGYLCLSMFGFLQYINFVSVLLGKLRVATHT
jgi:hypothetical protein